MNKKKLIVRIFIILILLVILYIVYTTVVFYTNSKKIALDKKTPEKLIVMSVPKDTIKLKYTYDIKTLGKTPSKRSGEYIYCGNNNKMSFMDVEKKLFMVYDGNALYTISDAFLDSMNNVQINYKIEKNNEEVYSTMRVDSALDILQSTPLLGIYQPGQFIFLNSNVEYANGKAYKVYPTQSIIDYDSSGNVVSVKSKLYGEFYFKNFTYFKSIDMTIPTEIDCDSYKFGIKINKMDKKLIKREHIKLVSAEKADNRSISLLSMQRPPFVISIYDLREVNPNTGFKYNPKMGTVDEASKKHLEEKQKL